MDEFHICKSFTCCGTPSSSLRIPVDPEALRYQVVAGPGVKAEEIAPGLTAIEFDDDTH